MQGAELIGKQIQEAEDLPWVVISHLRPDGDATGSLVAAWSLLSHLGKEAYVVAPDGAGAGFEDLLDQASHQTDPPTFVSYNLLMVDCSRSHEHMGVEERYIKQASKVLIIDHHPYKHLWGNSAWIDLDAPSATCMVWDLASALCPELCQDKLFARACYGGLATDTGQFMHANTTPRAHEAAAQMLSSGIRASDLRSLSAPPTTLRVQKILAQALLDLEARRGGQILSTYFDAEGLTSQETDYLKAAIFRIMSRTEGAVMLILWRLQKDVLPISLRCNHPLAWDMNQLAQKFGGGGHTGAAGIKLALSAEDNPYFVGAQFVEEVVQLIEDTYGP